MRVSVGMWNGDPPARQYYCLVCDNFINDADFLSECSNYDEGFPTENWAVCSDYRDRYAVTEAKHSDYIRKAGVPTQRDWIALLNMYGDLS